MVDLMFPAHIYIGSLSEPGTAEFILGESWIEAGIPFNMEWASSHNTMSKNDAVPCASVFPHDITVCTESKKNANRKKSKQKPHQKSRVLLETTMALHSRGVHRNTNWVRLRLHVQSHDFQFKLHITTNFHFSMRDFSLNARSRSFSKHSVNVLSCQVRRPLGPEIRQICRRSVKSEFKMMSLSSWATINRD